MIPLNDPRRPRDDGSNPNINNAVAAADPWIIKPTTTQLQLPSLLHLHARGDHVTPTWWIKTTNQKLLSHITLARPTPGLVTKNIYLNINRPHSQYKATVNVDDCQGPER